MTALLTLPLLAAVTTGSLAALAPALLLAGAATAPTMVTGMSLLQHRTPPTRLNEAMTLAVTALLAGIAAGTATTGWLADHTAPASGLPYLVPPTAAALALTLAILSTRPAAEKPRLHAPARP